MQHAATLTRRSPGSDSLDHGLDHGLDHDLAVWSGVLGQPNAPTATVIDLDAERAVRRAATHRVHVRRRLTVALGVLALALALALVVGAVGATADLERPAVTGQVVLSPGDTLWEVATQHAPAGVDARVYLQAIRDVNGFATADVPAWTTILLPAVAG